MRLPILSIVCASVLSATPIGVISLSSPIGGGVNVQDTRIDFFNPINLPPALPGFGTFVTGNPTNILYSGGVVNSTTDPAGLISDLDSNPPFPPGGLDFILFTSASTLHFDILSFGPGGPAQGAILGCVGAGFTPCSPSLGGGNFSPFILRFNGTGTTIELSAQLLGHDSTGSILWNSAFTTQRVGLNSAQIESLFLAGDVETNTWSFNAASVPEPGTLMITGIGIVLVLTARRRRNATSKRDL